MTQRFQADRRQLTKAIAFLAVAGTAILGAAEDARLHGSLPPWQEGFFDLHHIDTGRGNATLLIFPDGTTLLIDAGAADGSTSATTAPARPDSSRRPGEWIARYVLAHAPSKRIDYFLATHIHPDHVAGLADVQDAIPIGTYIDRAFPNYFPAQQPASAEFAAKYLDLLKASAASGHTVQAAQVGSTTQIKQGRSPGNHFSACILASNGVVWNPVTQTAESHLDTLPPVAGIQGNENLFSVALRFTYGPFSYYTGGDLSFDTHDGRMPVLDIETPVARAAGRTEVAVANHHGYFDACGPDFTNTLDAQAYIVPSWDIGHPGSAQMQRMLGAWDGKATHDVFALELLPANALTNRRFAPQLKSQQGHAVVRVAPGGKTFNIYTLDSEVENGNISGVFGPYRSRG